MSEKTSVLRTAVWERSRNGESVSEIARALNTDERIVTLIVNTFERLESKRRAAPSRHEGRSARGAKRK